MTDIAIYPWQLLLMLRAYFQLRHIRVLISCLMNHWFISKILCRTLASTRTWTRTRTMKSELGLILGFAKKYLQVQYSGEDCCLQTASEKA